MYYGSAVEVHETKTQMPLS